jgi:hypothetical protein
MPTTGRKASTTIQASVEVGARRSARIQTPTPTIQAASRAIASQGQLIVPRR